ncbi:AAA domain-containing protein [Sphingomonas sp. NFR04]|uniref:AAA family ATPase n=1 Tax=Sphingomonas sp. NFR04 TaxID=1566283 RepID=UPI0008F0A432|nr:AAA family ATPase [Sphingomonas sp. NFR04]SFJ49303.1 AAA domain-containing protein [Sphingomonas sp. NFR04]
MNNTHLNGTRIGFAGAHRVGKTTLARAIAKLFDVPFLSSSAGVVAEIHGFDMERHNRLNTGTVMQGRIMDAMVGQIEASAALSKAHGGPVSYVCDRTPIDAAAYYLADASAAAGSPRVRDDCVQYVESAISLTAQHFDLVILVPPAITFEPMDGKPPMNAAYQEHIHFLVRGMLFDESLADMAPRIGTILRENTDRADRIATAADFVAATFGLANRAAA